MIQIKDGYIQIGNRKLGTRNIMQSEYRLIAVCVAVFLIDLILEIFEMITVPFWVQLIFLAIVFIPYYISNILTKCMIKGVYYCTKSFDKLETVKRRVDMSKFYIERCDEWYIMREQTNISAP